jgi:ubiquinone/menaquinone biosynthesis C-methylase UbiE
MTLTEEVRAFWERTPCGTGGAIVGDAPLLSRGWFERIESHRYAVEPFIHSVAQFTRHGGKRLLEIGVGAGTDHLQWARGGAQCHGVDLTQAAIDTTRAHLALYGLSSRLQRLSAEALPYPDASFDLVYSWGVIHHAERPEAIVSEIQRVLRPGGEFIGMLYARRSLVTLRYWLRYALLAGRPWRSPADVIWNHMESTGTRCYTRRELRRLFAAFQRVETRKLVTPYDTARLPGWLAAAVPDALGWNIAVRASK